MDALKERLKELRGEVPQKTAADAIGIDQQSLSRYERGERKPDAEILLKIANYYRVSVAYLVGQTKLKAVSEEYETVSDVTGLTDAAILTLEQSKADPDTREIVDMVLGSDHFAHLIDHFAKLKQEHNTDKTGSEKYKYDCAVRDDLEELRREIIVKITGIKKYI